MEMDHGDGDAGEGEGMTWRENMDLLWSFDI